MIIFDRTKEIVIKTQTKQITGGNNAKINAEINAAIDVINKIELSENDIKLYDLFFPAKNSSTNPYTSWIFNNNNNIITQNWADINKPIKTKEAFEANKNSLITNKIITIKQYNDIVKKLETNFALGEILMKEGVTQENRQKIIAEVQTTVNTNIQKSLDDTKNTIIQNTIIPNTIKIPILRYLKQVYDLVQYPNLNSNIEGIDLANFKFFLNTEYYPVINYLKKNYEWTNGLPNNFTFNFNSDLSNAFDESNNIGYNALQNGLIVANRYMRYVQDINIQYKQLNNNKDVREILDPYLWEKEQNGSYKFKLPTTLDLTKNIEPPLNNFMFNNIFGYFIADYYYIALYYMYYMYGKSNDSLNNIFTYTDMHRQYAASSLFTGQDLTYFFDRTKYNNENTPVKNFTYFIKKYNNELSTNSKLTTNSKLKPITLNLINEILF